VHRVVINFQRLVRRGSAVFFWCAAQCGFHSFNMVGNVQRIISEYHRRLLQMPHMPKPSYGHSAVGINGSVNTVFLTFLFCDLQLGIQFIKDVGLLRSNVSCDTCGRDMGWYADSSTRDGFRWRCIRKVAGAKCSLSKAIRHGSWFQQSNLTFQEVLYLTYDTFRYVHAFTILLPLIHTQRRSKSTARK
jgi:hypothetical protein